MDGMGVFLLLLAAIFILGNLWFHLVEAMLDRIKRLLQRHREPPAWHPLPRDQENGPKD